MSYHHHGDTTLGINCDQVVRLIDTQLLPEMNHYGRTRVLGPTALTDLAARRPVPDFPPVPKSLVPWPCT